MRIKVLLSFCIFFIGKLFFCQSLEDDIYLSLDEFVDNPSKEKLQILNHKSDNFRNKISTNNEKLAFVILLCNKGYYEKKFGLINKAITSYEEGLNLFEKNQLTNYDIIEYNLKPLGHLYTISKNLSLAESTIKKYIFLAEKSKNKHHKTAGILNLSVVYNNLGNYKTAIALLNKELLQKHLNSVERKNLENNLATNLIAIKQYDNANKLLKKGIDYQTLKNKAFIAIHNHDIEQATDLFKQSKNEFLKSDFEARDYVKLLIDESNLYKISNQKDIQKNLLLKALNILKPKTNISIYPEPLFSVIYDELALLENNLNKKLELFNKSFENKSLLYNEITSLETLMILENEDKWRTEKCIEICLKFYEKTKQQKYLREALLYAENNKNISLKQNYISSLQKNKQFNERKLLLQEKDKLINLLIRNEIKQDKNINVEKINKSLNFLEQSLRQINQKLNLNHIKTDENFLKKVFKKIDSKKAVINYYFYGKDNIYTFILGENITLKINKKTETYNKTIVDYIHFFDHPEAINNQIDAFKETSLSLFKSLNIPLTEDKIIIIPDGILNFVPFESLLTKEIESKKFNQMPFLIRMAKISYQSNLLFFERTIKPFKNKKIVGFFPVFKKSKHELPYTLEEAKVLEKLNAKNYYHEKASKLNFLKEIKSANILHVATHGTSGNFSNPSALLFFDDQLMLQELNNQQANNCNFVFLSACETGVGKLYKGEGSMSIARGFQMANVPNLMYSLWEINDFTTSKIVTNFYNSYEKNESFYQSNYDSKINYLDDKSIDNTKKSPYYWSAFVYFGEIDNPNNSWWLLILGILIVSLVTVILLKYKKFNF